MTHFDLYDPTDTHAHLRKMVKQFAKTEIEPGAKNRDERQITDVRILRRLGSELSVYGLTLPEQFGGAGLDATATIIVCEELSRVDPGIALSYLAHEVLFVNNLFVSGSEDLWQRYLPDVLCGKKIAGMAMTEPGAGTDVLAMKTVARPNGDHYLVSGTKQFITNGPIGDVFLVYAKSGDDKRNISSFVISKETDGFSIGRKEEKLGMRASPTSQLILDECVVPCRDRVGDEGGALQHMMRNLEIERVALAAQSMGIALRCIDEMVAYSRERIAFGQPIIQFGQMQQMIAESYAHTHAARAFLYDVARRIDPNTRTSLYASSAKLVATPLAEKVARNAIQVFGGYGYTRDHVVERFLRDAILLSIGGGTNEAMQKNIAKDLFEKVSDGG